MEENNPAPTVMTVVDSNLNKDDGENDILNEEDARKKITDEGDPPCSLQESDGEDKEDDVEVVIIGEEDNKTIELDEDSNDETQINLDRRSDELSNVANDSFKRATEFVIVNAANVSAEATEVTAPIEALQIKDELAETITAEVNTNDILENDPMDLLELNNRSESTNSTRSHDGTDDYGDDVSSIGSSSVQTGSSSTSNLDWIKDHPWLLYEEGEEPFGYCLYCDAKINIKSQSSVKQHGTSLYHKERCENYLAFRDEEERNGLSMKLVEVKEEFGTDSRVEALKLKRKSQSGALNNFNWRRWLEDYPWLERDSAEGTVGYCKYCQIHVNVEFSYLRDRHNEGAKHREAEKQYEEPTETNEKNETSNLPEEPQKEPAADSQSKTNQRWLEVVENEPNMSRCKVCGTKMFKNNFLRHLRTNLHEHNEKNYLQNQKTAEQKASDEESGKNQQSWKLYTKHHPWLVSDPTDASFGYCKYCEKRFVYGSSAAKRATHENSSQHKQNEVDFKKRNTNPDKEQTEKDKGKNVEKNSSEDNVEGNDEEDKDAEEDNEEEEESSEDDENADADEDEDENDQDNEDDKSEQEKESEEENESKKRVYKLSDEWLNQYSWCKRHNKDPKNFFFCIYCKIPLSVAYSRSKHQSTSFHISAEREFLNRQAKRQKLQERKLANESPFFEWAVPLRNDPKSYSCRYCRVRISKNYSKKQHASSKIHQINESIYKNNRRKSVRKDETANNENSQPEPEVVTEQTSVEAPKKKQTFAIKAPSTVTLIKKWQKKFPWLSYKRSELRSHYGHCKICETSLYIRSLKHVLRHVRSGRHVSISKAKKKQKVEKDEEDDDDGDETSAKIIKNGPKEESHTPLMQVDASDKNLTKQPTTISTAAEEKTLQSKKPPISYNFKSTIAEMKKRYSWIEKSERPNYGSCRFCNVNIPLKVLFLRNHSNSQKHRHCVINYSANDRKKGNRVTPQANNADSDENDNFEDDVMIVEENNEEILISEQDENWTVKSETMDEHEELDYLLQRSFNNIQNKSNMQRSNVRKSTNADDDQPAKRFKRSLSSRRLNNSNTSLVASLLTTPLTLASCLGPLIQQQIQQQTNTSQTSANVSTMSSAEAQKSVAPAMAECENTFDLFFKSISETMKKLPVDLAAEGKLRVMQIICDLELQALKRQQQSVQCETSSINTSGGLSYQATSTSGGQHSGCNSSVINDLSAEQNGNCNETIITQINTNTELSPPLTTHLTPTAVNSSSVEKTSSSNTSTPVIGVMDKNGLQTLHLKSALSKQIPKSTVNTTSVTTVASSGIRCIPFKNLSQPATPDTSNTKITRIQVPITIPAQPQNSNPNAVNPSKNLINFRNIQITKRIANSPTSASASSGTNAASPHQQAVPSTMANNSPQRTFITNIQPQLQRWGCSVNGATTLHTPTSSTVNQLKQLSSQQTSTPVSKK